MTTWRNKLRLNIDKDEIYNLYFNKKYSKKKLCIYFKCSEKAIEYRFREWGWEFRNYKEAANENPKNKSKLLPYKEDIIRLYNDENKTCKDLSKIYNLCESTIERFLRNQGVTLRNNNARQSAELTDFLDENIEEIKRLYLEEKLSTSDIGKKFNKNDETIRNYLIRYKIPIRNTYESLIKYDLDYLDNMLQEQNCIRITNINDFNNFKRSRKIEVKCLIHDYVWSACVKNLLQGTACPLCHNKSEGFVHNLLLDIIGIENIERQYYLCDYEYQGNKHKVFVDFFIPYLNHIIEYNGLQHYEKIDGWNGDVGFEKRKYRDNIVKKFCIENNIKLTIIDGREYKSVHVPRFSKRRMNLRSLLCSEFA